MACVLIPSQTGKHSNPGRETDVGGYLVLIPSQTGKHSNPAELRGKELSAS